jgi:hypothetical protein
MKQPKTNTLISRAAMTLLMMMLDATLRADANLVARLVEAAHQENTSIIRYSDENSMACVLAIAYYYAHGDYIFHRERLRVGEQSSGMYQTGRGFADLVMIPRKNVTTPAIIVEHHCEIETIKT